MAVMTGSNIANRLSRGVRTAWTNVTATASFVLFAVRRFDEDRGMQVASALTYTSLLGLVPILAMVLAIFTGFPGFADMRDRVKSALLAPLMPNAGEQARTYIDMALANTNQLTAIGVVGLAVTAILLLSTIEAAFNQIWRVVEPRPLWMRLLSFWAVLTVGPLLLGISLSLSSYLFGMAGLTGAGELGRIAAGLARFMPFALQTVAFMLLFLIIPNRRVNWAHAIAGALVASVLFELLKWGFGLYVGSSDVYTKVYGALASIPIFLLWLYLSWSVVLLGAEVAAAMPEWRSARLALKREAMQPAERLAAALALLRELWLESRSGGTRLGRETLARRVPRGVEAVDIGLADLQRAGYVAGTDDGRLVLTRDLGDVSLYTLHRDLRLDLGRDLGAEFGAEDGPAWAARLGEILLAVDAGKRAAMDMPVKRLILEGDGKVPPPGSAQPADR